MRALDSRSLRPSFADASAARRALSAAATQPTVPLAFVEDNETIDVDAKVGQSLLEVAHANDIDLEGACDGSLACSTCHLVLDQATYDALPPPCEEELDMLDLAMGLTDTSRLGCQIKVTAELAHAKFMVPDAANNIQAP